jgi:hypothetical protein
MRQAVRRTLQHKRTVTHYLCASRHIQTKTNDLGRRFGSPASWTVAEPHIDLCSHMTTQIFVKFFVC